MKKFYLLILSFGMLMACSSEEVQDKKNVTVILTSVVSGTLNNGMIHYRNAAGALQTETLPVGNWSKTFKVEKGFNLLLKASGTINGDIEIKASASGGDVSFSDDRNLSTNVDASLDLEITTTL